MTPVTELFRLYVCSQTRFQQRCATAGEFDDGQFADKIDGPGGGRRQRDVLTIFGLPLPYAALR